MTTETCDWGIKFEERKCKEIVFRARLHEKYQTKIEMILDLFYKASDKLHFTSENVTFCDICLSVCLSVTNITCL